MAAAIVHFEIQVTDPERAVRFYHDVFEWRVEKVEGAEFYGVWTGRSKYASGSTVGLDGGLGTKEGNTPPANAALNAFLCTVEVENIDETLSKVAASGGVIITPKYAFPQVGWMATCADPDGNRFGLIQNDIAAQ